VEFVGVRSRCLVVGTNCYPNQFNLAKDKRRQVPVPVLFACNCSWIPDSKWKRLHSFVTAPPHPSLRIRVQQTGNRKLANLQKKQTKQPNPESPQSINVPVLVSLQTTTGSRLSISLPPPDPYASHRISFSSHLIFISFSSHLISFHLICSILTVIVIVIVIVIADCNRDVFPFSR